MKVGPSTDMSRILGTDGYRYDPRQRGGRVPHQPAKQRTVRPDGLHRNDDDQRGDVHLRCVRGRRAGDGAWFKPSPGPQGDVAIEELHIAHEGLILD